MNRHERRRQAKLEQRQLGPGTDPAQLVARGMAQHQAGEIDAAEVLYQSALRLSEEPTESCVWASAHSQGPAPDPHELG